jgi:hypothetical protein
MTNKKKQDAVAKEVTTVSQELQIAAPTTVIDPETGEVMEVSTQVTDKAIEDDQTGILAAISKSHEIENLKPVIQLTAEYIELVQPGDYFDGVFIGFQKITVKDKQSGELREIGAVRFAKQGKIVLNAGANLVNSIKSIAMPPGTPVRVQYTKKDGNVKIYNVSLLG